MQRIIAPVLLLLSSVTVRGADCAALQSLKLPHAIVESAAVVAAGAYKLPDKLYLRDWAGNHEVSSSELPAFCRVELRISPIPESNIRVELRLPIESWNNRFIGVGNSGAAGQINYRAMSGPTSRGYAVASTDTGHESSNIDTSWAIGHPELVVDHAYRAVHEMAVTSKLVIRAFYGRPARYSYFNGTSTGGRQALKATQMYPEDYDGVVAGAPFIYGVQSVAADNFRRTTVPRQGAAPIPPEKLKLLNDAALKACDSLDGLADGVIGDPTICKVDLSTLSLTPAELSMAKSRYGPVQDPRSGAEIQPGFAYGSELGWTFPSGDDDWLPNMILNRAGWDKPFDLVADLERFSKIDVGRMSADSTNLRPFFQHGGKLIMVHGWADPGSSPFNPIKYYRAIAEALGEEGVQKSLRLYLVPGMGHSRGGLGVTDFDSITVAEDWVEQGKAPNAIPGRRLVDEKPVFTRPLCPYPQVIKYRGTGDPNSAASFACVPSQPFAK